MCRAGLVVVLVVVTVVVVVVGGGKINLSAIDVAVGGGDTGSDVFIGKLPNGDAPPPSLPRPFNSVGVNITPMPSPSPSSRLKNRSLSRLSSSSSWKLGVARYRVVRHSDPSGCGTEGNTWVCVGSGWGCTGEGRASKARIDAAGPRKEAAAAIGSSPSTPRTWSRMPRFPFLFLFGPIPGAPRRRRRLKSFQAGRTRSRENRLRKSGMPCLYIVEGATCSDPPPPPVSES